MTPAEGHLYVFCHPPGSGKTFAICDLLAKLPLQERVLVLTKTKEQALLLCEQIGPRAFYLQGRESEADSPFYCAAYQQMHQLAQARHDTTAFCKACYVQHPDCRYKAREALGRTSSVVVATAPTFLNEGSRIAGFKVIIIEESLLESNLVEMVEVTRSDLLALECAARQVGYAVDHPIWRIFNSLHTLLVACPQSPKDTLDARLLWLTEETQAYYRALVQAEGSSTRFIFEQPSEEGTLVKRCLTELLTALVEGDHRVLLNHKGLLFARARGCLAVLKQRTVINLDATPALALLTDMWGPDHLTVIGGEVSRPNVRLHQIIGNVMSTEFLVRDAKKRTALSELIDQIAAPYQHPLLVLPKELCPGSGPSAKTALSVSHPGVKAIWYGNQTRALNEFQSCDAVILAGHFQEPPFITELKVTALRCSPPLNGAMYKALVPFDLVGDETMLLARQQWRHPDPLVDTTISDLMRAEVLQAIGRARALLRAEPVPVYLINGWAYPGLPVDAVIPIEQFRAANRHQRPHLQPLNTSRHQEAWARIQAIYETHPDLSLNQLAQLAGAHKKTVRAFLEAIRKGQ